MNRLKKLGYVGEEVFPTGVGMNRVVVPIKTLRGRIPHGCGDEPTYQGKGEYGKQYSPRVWG